MLLQTLTIAHADLLAGMHRICFVEHWDKEAMASLLATPGTFGFLAQDDGPQGFILCRAAAGEAEILTVMVLPPYRRHKVGAKLLDAAFRSARDAGAQEMFLEVAADNMAGQGLYSTHGFEQVGLRPRYYDGKTDALVLRRNL